MSIRLIKAYKGKTVGTVLNLDDDVEETLIREGFAVTTNVHTFSVWPNLVRTATNAAGDATPAVAATLVIPGKKMIGPNSVIKISFFAELNTAVATSKQINIKINGNTIAAPSTTSNTAKSMSGQTITINMGATNSQRTQNVGFNWMNTSSSAVIATAVDTAQDFTITFETLWGAAVANTETITFVGAIVEIL